MTKVKGMQWILLGAIGLLLVIGIASYGELFKEKVKYTPDDEGSGSGLGICPDEDSDGYAVCDDSCNPSDGVVCGDCDDEKPDVHPGATESGDTCFDSLDNDCSGLIDPALNIIGADCNDPNCHSATTQTSEGLKGCCETSKPLGISVYSLVNFDNDYNNCGSCGNICSGDSYCYSGSCHACLSITCPPEGQCSYITTDLFMLQEEANIISTQCFPLGEKVFLVPFSIPDVMPPWGACGPVPGTGVDGLAISCGSPGGSGNPPPRPLPED